MAKPAEFLRIFSDLKSSVETTLINGVKDINGLHDLEVVRDAMLDLVMRATSFLERSKGRIDIMEDRASWQQIESLRWSHRFDWEGISKKLNTDPELRDRLSAFAERAVDVLLEAGKEAGISLGDDETDILYHIVGLGRSEFIKALEEPKKVLLGHAKGQPDTRDGYVKSFAYALQKTCTFPPLEEQSTLP